MSKIACVYRILNTTNGRTYIGSTIHFVQRKWRHFYDLNRGRHASAFMQRDFLKCGKDAFSIEIVERVSERSELINREQYWLDTTSPEYNSAKVAGTVFGIKHSTETVQRNRERNTGFGNGNTRVSEQQAIEIAGIIGQHTQAELAKKYQVNRTTIQRVCKRLGNAKNARFFNSVARATYSTNARKNIAGRNRLSVYMLSVGSHVHSQVPSLTAAAEILGVYVSAVSKRLKRSDISHIGEYFISKKPIDAAMVAWPYRRAK